MAERETRFSIIIPAYNVADYIETALRSVLAQSYAAWEVIAVDDGSTDDTAAILDRYGRLDARIRVIHQANGGVSSARNKGLENAAGDYIVFLDGDDALPGDALTRLDQVVKSTGSDLITFGCKTFVKDEEIQGVLVSGDEGRVCYDLTVESDAAKAFERVVGSLLAWNGCFRREILSAVRFEHFSNGEDMLFGTAAFCMARTCTCTSLQLYLYRVGRAGSAVASSTVRKVKSVCDVTERWCEVVSRWNMAKHVRSAVSRKLRSCVLGVLCGFADRVPQEEQQEARGCVLGLFRLVWVKFPEYAKSFGRVRGALVCRANGWTAFCLLERIPFSIRVKALQFDFVKRVKRLVRG